MKYLNEIEPSPLYKLEPMPTERRKGKRLLQRGVIFYYDAYHGTYFKGPASCLLAAGLVQYHMLPGQPGRNKTSQTIAPSEVPNGREIKVFRRSTYLFEVYLPYPREEQQRRLEKMHEERQPPARTAPVKPNVQLKSKEQAFKDDARSMLKCCLRAVRCSLMQDEEDGLQFDESTLIEFERLAEEMEVLLSDDEHLKVCNASISSEDRLDMAKKDLQLQAFLQTVALDNSLVKSERREGL